MAYLIGGRGSIKGKNNTITGTGSGDKILGDNYPLGNDPGIFPTYGGSPLEAGVSGHDTINGNGGNDTIWGDAFEILGTAKGGNDVINGGTGNDLIYGDAERFYDRAIGGNDTIDGGIGVNDVVFGDGRWLIDDTVGGNDSVRGAEVAYGDAFEMFDFARGGNDTIIGDTTSNLHGDALVGSGSVTGGADSISTGYNVYGDFYDAGADYVTITCGNDTISGATSVAYGDANVVSLANSTIIFGNDSLTNVMTAFGDASSVDAYEGACTVLFGADAITGTSTANTISGDGDIVRVTGLSTFTFGADSLEGLAGNDVIYGDTSNPIAGAFIAFGSDTIVGGSGDDYMVGDAFASATAGQRAMDYFVFESGSGLDTIDDFVSGQDKIVLVGIDPASFNPNLMAIFVDTPGQTPYGIIAIDGKLDQAGDEVKLLNVTSLNFTSDIIFA